MKEKIKTICLILITLAILVTVVFYCWDTIEKQRYFGKEEIIKKQEEQKKQEKIAEEIEIKYQACKDQCWEKYTTIKGTILTIFPEYDVCEAKCREKYGK